MRHVVGAARALVAVVVVLVGSAQAQAFPRAEIQEWTGDVAVWHRGFAEWHASIMDSQPFQEGRALSSLSLPAQAQEGRRLMAQAYDLRQRGDALIDRLMAFQGDSMYSDLALGRVHGAIARVGALNRAMLVLLATSSGGGMSALEFELRTDLAMVYLQLAALSDEAYR